MSDLRPELSVLDHLLERAAGFASATDRIQHVLAWLVPLVQGDVGVVLLGSGSSARLVATRGFAADALADFIRAPRPAGESLIDRVLATRGSMLLEPLADDRFGPADPLEQLTVGTLVVVPIVTGAAAAGVLAVAWHAHQMSAATHVALLEAAGHCLGSSIGRCGPPARPD